MTRDGSRQDEWPALPYEEWRPTRDTLHMYSQILGKLRLALSPFEPEWAHVPLYVTARGLTTSPLPSGSRTFDAELDLVAHEVVIRSSDGAVERCPLGGAVADVYAEIVSALARIDVEVAISPLPSEVADPIPFPDDRTHATYVREHVERFHRVLTLVDMVTREHRAGFRGRTTAVQFFWGTFDLAVARYSGRPAATDPGAGVIERVGGDAEEICVGWWPGDARVPYPAFYAYAYPAPDGIDGVDVQPGPAGWSDTAHEFLLPYDAARAQADPRRAILDFYASTYAGAAALLGWPAEWTEVSGPGRARHPRR